LTGLLFIMAARFFAFILNDLFTLSSARMMRRRVA
jgi:hypothetical protein